MRLPPLNALRAFEAAARHGGYIEAAEELHVTRGAISRHVKSLEDHMGVQLFRRHARGVELTQAGKALLPILTDAFRRIAEGASRVSKHAELRIICAPAFSIRWIMPRLPEFRARHPEIPVRITTAFYGSHGFDGLDYDIGFSGEVPPPNRPPDIHVQRLLPWVMSPGCAPSLLERFGPVTSPNDLARLPLLLESRDDDFWMDWQRKFRIPDLDFENGDVFPNFDLVVKAAVMGAGVVMADLFLAREELTAGSLVLPWPDMLAESRWGWLSLICKDAIRDEPKVSAFRAWIAEIAETDRSAVFAGTPYA